ncbi:DUF5908 family protein [Roseateles chitosanitabidus]|uniref:DUF5908 family protein n=1 Tax=Roseateles chitosanitabidus TaxID=65048 RepID=UPI000831BB9A|nr:DUF5908 family protein [Roseateles chitosanitabidus]
MTLEVRQLVLRAQVRGGPDDEDEVDADGRDGARARPRSGGAKAAGGCGGGEDDPCEDKETLKEEILAACKLWLREQLRAHTER